MKMMKDYSLFLLEEEEKNGIFIDPIVYYIQDCYLKEAEEKEEALEIIALNFIRLIKDKKNRNKKRKRWFIRRFTGESSHGKRGRQSRWKYKRMSIEEKYVFVRQSMEFFENLSKKQNKVFCRKQELAASFI